MDDEQQIELLIIECLVHVWCKCGAWHVVQVHGCDADLRCRCGRTLVVRSPKAEVVSEPVS